MQNDIKTSAKAILPQIIAWRRELHQCPELQMDTVQTAGVIVRVLREIGIEEIRTKIGGNGVAAVIRGQNPGKCLGIRADCDGLPIREETGLPFASQNVNMHACGHDAHTAMALGAAKLLYERRHELCGTVKLVFQPFEEGDGGSRRMIADGVLEDPKVDAMIALHTGSIFAGFESGEIGYSPGPMSFCITAFWAKFHGLAAHASSPHLSHDALYMACCAVTQLQAVMSRERDPFAPAIASVSVIDGGSQNNIIPDECYIEGSIRSRNKEQQAFYRSRVEAICRSAAQSMRGSLEFGDIFNLTATENDSALYQKFLKIAPRVIEPEKLREIKDFTPIGEDFARYTEHIPCFYFFHCSRPREKERDFPHHNPKFDIDESTLWSGAALFAQFALDWQEEGGKAL